MTAAVLLPGLILFVCSLAALVFVAALGLFLVAVSGSYSLIGMYRLLVAVASVVERRL